ncbi:MAG: hypothetical protein K2H98_00600, partial [Duncaniella sp.]|nr:hypothetical protein [Duncaniella sp.]
NSYSDNEYSCDILLEIARTDFDAFTPEKWLEIVGKSISNFPKYKDIAFIKQIQDYIKQKSVEISLPEIVLPGQETEISVTMGNVNHAYLNIYDVSRLKTDVTDDSLDRLVPIARIPLTSICSIPFKDRQKVKFIFPYFGHYKVMPSYGKCTSKNSADVYVTSLAAVSRENSGERSVLILDRNSGQAVADAAISAVTGNNRRNVSYNRVGQTSDSGLFMFNESNKGGQYAVTKGEDHFTPTFYIPSIYAKQKSDKMKCRIYPSLPLYHQGDTLEWAALLYKESITENLVAPLEEVTVILNDVNSQPVDTLCTRTDSFGRVTGKFCIPKDQLTGYYTLSVKSDGYITGSCSVMVSDYVIPSFQLSLSPVENNAPSEGDVTLRGEVNSYSGFSIGGTPVTMKLMNVAPFSYFYRSALPYDMVIYTDTVSTDAQGHFSVVVPKSVISDAPMPGALFIAELLATTSSGESQSATTSFMISPSYRLNLSASDINVQAPELLTIPVSVTDYKNEPVNIELKYTIARKTGTNSNDTERCDAVLPADKAIETRTLPSGRYKITISTADNSLATPVTMEAVIYRIT